VNKKAFVLIGLMLVVLSSSPTLPQVHGQAYILTDYAMCKGYDTTTYDPIDLTNGFLTTDNSMTCWFKLKLPTDIYLACSLLWIGPTGEVYSSWNMGDRFAAGTRPFVVTQPIKNSPAAQKIGVWRAEAYVNGTIIFTEYFTIGDYLINVELAGFPPAHSVNVLIDNIFVGKMRGGQIKKFAVATGVHIISVDKTIEILPGTRYFCPYFTWTYTAEQPSHTFTYLAQCLITLVFKDSVGATSISPPKVIVTNPGGVNQTLTSYTDLWLDKGVWKIKQVMWQNIDVKPDEGLTINITTPQRWTINCRVYDLKITVKDILGLPAPWASVSVTLPNQTTVQTQTGGNGTAIIPLIPCGSFVAKISCLWQDTTVTGNTLQATTISAQLTFSLLTLLAVIIIIAVAVTVYILWQRSRRVMINVGKKKIFWEVKR